MVIAIASDLETRQRAWMVNGILLILTFFFVIYMFLPTYGLDGEEFHPQRQALKTALEAIGCGPLALNGMRQFIPVPALRTELILLGKNRRPDTMKKEVLLGLKSSNEERVVYEGETLYLRQTSDQNLSFSMEKTPLFICPMLLEDHGVLMEVSAGDQKGRFLLKEISHLPQGEEPHYAGVLKKAAAWGQDVLLEQYGGEEYFSFRNKVRIEFADIPSVCFVEPGDLLIWNEKGWQPVSLENFSPHLPLARITAVSGREVEMEVWDETGFHPIDFRLPIRYSPRSLVKIEEIFTALRPRTGTEITCLLDKKRVVLKEGDWWLKTESGWHKLKTVTEIEDLLQHKLRGELVIFDHLETEKGKAVLKGHLFDAMRTQVQPISLSASTDKKNLTAGRKKPAHTVVARGRDAEKKT